MTGKNLLLDDSEKKKKSGINSLDNLQGTGRGLRAGKGLCQTSVTK